MGFSGAGTHQSHYILFLVPICPSLMSPLDFVPLTILSGLPVAARSVGGVVIVYDVCSYLGLKGPESAL